MVGLEIEILGRTNIYAGNGRVFGWNGGDDEWEQGAGELREQSGSNDTSLVNSWILILDLLWWKRSVCVLIDFSFFFCRWVDRRVLNSYKICSWRCLRVISITFIRLQSCPVIRGIAPISIGETWEKRRLGSRALWVRIHSMDNLLALE